MTVEAAGNNLNVRDMYPTMRVAPQTHGANRSQKLLLLPIRSI